jgi:membrane fusion protein (multidrug efflux system)
MRKSKIIRSIILVLGISMVSFIIGCQPKAEKKEAQEEIPVSIAKVRLGELNEALEYVGNIKALEEVLVYPKVSGKIIEKVKKEGEEVNKGEALAYIDRDEVGLKFERAPVESPLTGVVGRIYVDVGQSVNAQTPAALVLNPDKVKVDLDIPEKYLPKISLGQEANIAVDAYPGEVFLGKVTEISPVVNLDNRTAPIEIRIENPGRLLKSGMFARVSLIIEKHLAVPVILKEAILGRGADTYVYVIENKRAVTRKVALGIHSGPYYEVRQGLKEGDDVVIVGQQRLYENALVSVEVNNNANAGEVAE